MTLSPLRALAQLLLPLFLHHGLYASVYYYTEVVYNIEKKNVQHYICTLGVYAY